MAARAVEISGLVKERVAALEDALSVPQVPGELSDWAENACQAAQQLAQALEVELSELRGQQFGDILKQDPALAPRVEEMRRADTEQLHVCQRLAKQLCTIEDQSEKRSEAETSLHERVAHLTECGLRLVVDLRKQDAAIDTWFQEAFQRDRGEGD